MIRRREFISLLGSAAAVWPVTVRAQERVRRIGIVTSVLEADADAQARYAVLRQALQQLGWTEGRNIQFDYRFGSAGDSDVVRRHAQELVALAPDLVVASGSQNVAALQQVSRTVPIVFLGIVDPVGAGFVASLARPGGNTTGLTPFEYGMGGKWLELLKQIGYGGIAQNRYLRHPRSAVQTILRHIDSAKREHCHLRIPFLLMRARAQATVRVWKKRPELQAHSRFGIRNGCGLPVATRVRS